MIHKKMDFTFMEQHIAVQFQVIQAGEDYLVMIVGGDGPHFGAVTLGDQESGMQTVARRHHREDEVTRLLYGRLSGNCPGGLGIVCGIHIDDIRPEQIRLVMRICMDGAKKIEECWMEKEKNDDG